MTLLDYIAIFILLDIVWIIHIFIIKKKYFSFLNKAIFEKLFWKNKTWRWLFIMSLFSWILWSLYFDFYFAFLLWLFWILWELPNSFIKRRLWIKPWSYNKWVWVLFQYIFDTLDSIIAILIFLNFIYGISFLSNLLLLLAWFINHSLIDYFCYKIWIKKLNHPNPLIIFIQLIVWLVFQPYLYINSYYKKISIKIEKDKKYICIANHISKLDPFLICSSLDLKTVFKLIPFRYMVTKSYMDKYWKIIKIFGCYSAHILNNKWEKTHTLLLSKDFIERWETVFIFPEWWIWKKKFWVWAFWLNNKVEKSEILLFWIKKNIKYKIDFLWKKDINKKIYSKEKDFLKICKIFFNNIEKWILKK